MKNKLTCLDTNNSTNPTGTGIKTLVPIPWSRTGNFSRSTVRWPWNRREAWSHHEFFYLSRSRHSLASRDDSTFQLTCFPNQDSGATAQLLGSGSSGTASKSLTMATRTLFALDHDLKMPGSSKVRLANHFKTSSTRQIFNQEDGPRVLFELWAPGMIVFNLLWVGEKYQAFTRFVVDWMMDKPASRVLPRLNMQLKGTAM